MQGIESGVIVWGRALLVLLHKVYNWADLIRMSRMTVGEIRSSVEMIGIEHIRKVADQGILLQATFPGFSWYLSPWPEKVCTYTPRSK